MPNARKKQIKEIEGKRNEMKLEHKLSSTFLFFAREKAWEWETPILFVWNVFFSSFNFKDVRSHGEFKSTI